MIVSKEDAIGSIQGAVSKERMQLGRFAKRMPEASDKGTHRRFCMAGYHCLMPTAFLLLCHNPPT